uniref:Uncharacterized protein n=1 Tax=Setaria italica TaxID=4555 RepID=K4AHL0_SETIT
MFHSLENSVFIHSPSFSPSSFKKNRRHSLISPGKFNHTNIMRRWACGVAIPQHQQNRNALYMFSSIRRKHETD